jgi:hypothetical protein
MTAVQALITSMTFATPINGKTSWATIENRLRLWGAVPPDQQPYAALVTHREMDEYRGLGLLRRKLDLTVWCYARTDTMPGQPMLDTMMESFEAVFNVADNPSDNCNTLGGLVYWCRIEGRVFKDPGDIDSQALLILPISVEMP